MRAHPRILSQDHVPQKSLYLLGSGQHTLVCNVTATPIVDFWRTQNTKKYLLDTFVPTGWARQASTPTKQPNIMIKHSEHIPTYTGTKTIWTQQHRQLQTTTHRGKS